METTPLTAGLTDEQLESLALASRALLVRQAVEKLKRRERPTSREQAALDAAIRKHRKAPLSSAERVKKAVALRNTIKITQSKMTERRKLCASDPVLFLKTYLSDWFTKPFSQDQLDDVEDMRRLYMEGRNFFIVEPRGWGKTTRADGMALWAILNGWQRFVPLVAATLKMAKTLAGDVIQELADNDLLAEDWPDICLPIRAAYQRANAVGYITVTVVDPVTEQPIGDPCQPVRMTCSTTKLVLPAVRAVSDSPEIYNSVFVCAGLQEASRGLWHKTSTGERLRPDVVLIDDFQTDHSARSASQCATRIHLIKSTFKRMGGPSKKARIGIAATVICPGDAAHQLLDRKKHPDLNGIRKKVVYDWPVVSRYGMEQRGIAYDAAKDLWGQYITLRKQGHRDDDKGKAANVFYAEHRQAMDEGVRVGWDHGYDESLGELTTIQSAINIIADDGEATFMSECQNEPIVISEVQVRLTPDAVMHRVNGLAAGEVPADAQHVTCFVDMNDHALAWAAGAFRNEPAGGVTGSIIGYGEWAMNGAGIIGQTDRVDRIWDEKHPAPEGKEQRFWKALTALVTRLFTPGLFMRQGQPVLPELVLIDSGYTLEKNSRMLYNWTREWELRYRGGAMPCRGWAARTFRMRGPTKDVLRESKEGWWRMQSYELAPGVIVKTLQHDADFHKRQTQLAWQLLPGSPKSLTIYGKTSAEHERFAQQMAAEQLGQYQEAAEPYFSGLYFWNRVPGVRNEMLDCVSGCRLAAWALRGDAVGNVQRASASPVPTPSTAAQPAPRPVAPSPRVQRPRIQIMPGWEREAGMGFGSWGAR